MTDPLKSKYDSLPAWSPTIYSGSKGKEDEEKAAAKYAETYGGSTTYVDGDAPEAEAPVADTKTPTVSAAYTTAQLTAFRTGERKNDGDGIMQAIAKRLSDADTKALGEYYAGMR